MNYDVYNSSETLLVKYFLTLENTLPIAHESTFTNMLGKIQHSVRGIDMFITNEHHASMIDKENPQKFYSFMFHQIPKDSLSPWLSGIETIQTVLSKQGNKKSKKFLEEFNNKFEQKNFKTVVSIVTLLEPGEETFNHEDIPMSLIEGIKILESFVTSLKVIKHYPYDVRYETINSFVMRTAETLHGTIVDERPLLLHQNDVTETDFISEQEFHNTCGVFLRDQRKDPILRYLKYRNNGKNDLYINGDYSSACMNFGIAAEVMLSAVLSLSLWEDLLKNIITEDEITTILASPLATRVKTQYHPKFGGNWVPPIDAWDEKIAQPRNRVVHSGKDFPKEDAVHSLEELTRLQTFIADSLVNNVSKYPRTAWTIVGEEGFKSRNRLRSAEKAKAKISEPNEILTWLEEYNMWMNRISPSIQAKIR